MHRLRKTNAEYCQEYRARIKLDPVRLALFLQVKGDANAKWVAGRNDAQKERDKEMAKLRQREKRYVSQHAIYLYSPFLFALYEWTSQDCT